MPQPHARARTTAAFTLFEIAISLALVAFAVAVILPAFPAGLRAQQFARFRLLAAAKAEEMVEAFNTTHSANPATDHEAPDAWDIAVSRRSQAWDLEQRLASHRFGIMPLPSLIARRLDSADDEIQRILAEGGRLYYSQPSATTNVDESSQFTRYDPTHPEKWVPPPLANEAQKLVFAVTGYAQDNALHILPQKNWPYYYPYPSPPYHGLHYREYLPTAKPLNEFIFGPWLVQDGSPAIAAGTNGWDYNRGDWRWYAACLEQANDPDLEQVFRWHETAGPTPGMYGFLPYAYGAIASDPSSGNWNSNPAISPPSLFPGAGIPDRASLANYVRAAFWYAQKKGAAATSVGAPAWQDFILPATIPTGAAIGDFPAGMADDEKWMAVQAMRFLAHATACLTGAWYGYHRYGGDTEDLATGVKIDHVQLAGFDGPPGDQKVTLALIRYYHDRCLNCAMTFAASFPYDWAVPRPVERSQMMDFPLIEYDLFSPPLQGTINGTSPPIEAQQWKPIPSQPIVHGGSSYQYPADVNGNPTPLPACDVPFDAAAVRGFAWGNTDHFTLCAPFAPADRCRQIVFWAVDWMSYEDCELAPSASVDASKYPMSAPRGTAGGKFAPLGRIDFVARMGADSATGGWGGIKFWDQELFAYRNPEKSLAFLRDVGGKPTGADVAGDLLLNWHPGNSGQYWTPDEGIGTPLGAGFGDARMVFSGGFGADRNMNLKLDRGPLPPSARLRAIEVARFNYYDPRVPDMIR